MVVLLGVAIAALVAMEVWWFNQPTDLAPLIRSTLYVRVGPKGGPYATFPSHRRTDPRQIA